MKKILITILLSAIALSTPFRVLASTNTKSIVLTNNQELEISDASQTGLDFGSSDITMEYWIKYNTIPSSGVLFGLLHKTVSSNNRAWASYLYNNAGTLEFRFTLSTVSSSWAYNSMTAFPTLPSTDTWYHYAFTYDNSLGDTELFINGSSVGTYNGSSVTPRNNTSSFYFGNFLGAFDFDGKFDEAIFWTDIRTDAEILASYNSGAGKFYVGNETNMLSYWRFEDNSLDTNTITGNDLTLNNGAGYSTDVPFTGAAPAAILRKKATSPNFNIY